MVDSSLSIVENLQRQNKKLRLLETKNYGIGYNF